MDSRQHALPPEDLLANAGWIRALARSLVRDPSAADDLVQETWVAALRRSREGGETPRAWLAAVLRNFARQRMRSETSRSRRERSSSSPEALPSADELLVRIEHQKILVDGVTQLDEPYRSTVILRYYEGLSSADIARRQGIPPGRVRARLKRALDQLRATLDSRFEGGRQAWMSAMLPLTAPNLGPIPALSGAESALAAGALVVKKTAIAGALLALLGGAIWIVNHPSNSSVQDSPALAAATLVAEDAPGGDTRLLDERVDDAPRSDRSAAVELEGGPGLRFGRVEAPAVTLADEDLEVLVLREPTTYANFLSMKSATSASGDWIRETVPVDADGRFSISSGEGSVHLMIHGRYLYLAETQAVDLSDSTPFSITAKCGAWIRGHLVPPADAAGEAADVGGIAIEVSTDTTGLELGDRMLPEVVSLDLLADRAGRFELRAIPSGSKLEVCVLPEHLAALSMRIDDLQPCQRRDLDLPLLLGGLVRGRVLDPEGRTVAGADVHAAWPGRMLGFDATTVRETVSDDSGRFVLASLPPGEVRVFASRRGFLESQRVPLRVADRSLLDDLVLELDLGQTIAGSVRHPDGTAAAGVRVHAAFDRSYGVGPTAFNALRGASGETVTDEKGSFRLVGLGPGPFAVIAEQQGEGSEEDPPLHRARADGVKPGLEDLELVLNPPLSVSGVVVDSVGAPIESFRVRAERRVQGAVGESLTESAQEDFRAPDGRFTLSSLVAGRWTVWARAEMGVQVEPIVVELPAPTGTSLVLELLRPVVAMGIVTTPGGEPVADAEVVVDNGLTTLQAIVTGLPKPPATRTDELGRFELGGLAPTRLEIFARKEGWSRSAGRALDLSPDAAEEGLHLVLTEGGTVTGEVYDDQGRPAVGRMINVLQWELGEVDVKMARTDENGHFEVRNIPPGQWMVLAIDSGADFSSSEEGSNVGAMMSSMESASVDLEEGETVHLVLGAPAEDPVRVSGFVSLGGRPYTGVVVSFAPEDGATYASVRNAGVDAQGRYQLIVDGPGGYAVTVQRLSEGPGRQSSLEFKREVPAQPEVEIDLVMPTGRISGRILDADGEPAPGARVTLVQAGGLRSDRIMGGRYAELFADGSGRYSIDALGEGIYQVAAGGSAFFGGETTGPFARVLLSNLRIEAGTHLDDVNFRLPKPGAVEVLVEDETGAPVANAAIFVRAATGLLMEPISVCTTDGEGRALYGGLEAGTYTVSAKSGGLASHEAEVRVGANGTETVRVTLERATLIAVHLTDREGNPVSAYVTIFDDERRDVGGKYGMEDVRALMERGYSPSEVVVGPLPPGVYRIEARAEGGFSARKSVTLRGEAERRVNLRLRD